ncbi:hypothetical protein D3C83_328630 [compost metagenome]
MPSQKARLPISVPLAKAASRIASFEWKPAKPMPSITTPTPVIASVPAIIAQKVNGIAFRKPP